MEAYLRAIYDEYIPFDWVGSVDQGQAEEDKTRYLERMLADENRLLERYERQLSYQQELQATRKRNEEKPEL